MERPGSGAAGSELELVSDKGEFGVLRFRWNACRHGEGISPRDTSTSPSIAVVNETFVKKLFKPGENPIGRRFGSLGSESQADWEIVGVVEDTVYSDIRLKEHLMCFVPLPSVHPARSSL